MLSSSLPRPDTAAFASAASRLARGTRVDVAIGLGFALLTAALLLPRYGAFPMELWDESRNANNAIEMAANGNWLVTFFNGVPEHWNTKPPLLIWAVAALLRSGLPPLLALRLPPALATMAIVVALFAFCRLVLHDRLAGIFAGLLVLSSTLFLGPHVARTGDYDALLSLFVLIHVVAFGRYADPTEPFRHQWLATWGVALTLAVFTKGIAGVLVAPGVVAFVVLRRRLLSVLRDLWFWVAALVVVLVCGGYYVGRELADPGYLWSVWQFELGGRYLTTLANLDGGPLYYPTVLFGLFEPGFILVPLALLTLLRNASARRETVLLCLLAAGLMLLAITSAATKAFWYAAPLVPLLSLAVGIGLADAAAWLNAERVRQRVAIRPAVVHITLCAVIVASLVAGLYRQHVTFIEWAERPVHGQYWYGAFLDQLRADGLPAKLLIVDGGAANDADLINYRPIADFYRKVAANDGERIDIVAPGGKIAPGAWVLTCDPNVRAELQADPAFKTFRSDPRCVFGQQIMSSAGPVGAKPPTKG